MNPYSGGAPGVRSNFGKFSFMVGGLSGGGVGLIGCAGGNEDGFLMSSNLVYFSSVTETGSLCILLKYSKADFFVIDEVSIELLSSVDFGGG